VRSLTAEWGRVSGRSVKAQPIRSVTARQQQCLALIASGLTNKEIAHHLSITERGVAALVSRLLLRFDVSNRAGLVAQVMSDRLAQQAAEDAPREHSAWASFLPTLERDLDAYRNSPFMIAATIGREQRVVFLSDMMKRGVLGEGSENLVGTVRAERDQSPSAKWWSEQSDEVFVSGVAKLIETAPQHWPLRAADKSESLSCVVQPLRDSRGDVQGALWICILADS
jgi:DNA-binding CsgD family transcriptional regulator